MQKLWENQKYLINFIHRCTIIFLPEINHLESDVLKQLNL